MRLFSLWAFTALMYIASATRLACWRDIVMLDGVGTRADDGSFPLPASCNPGVAVAPPSQLWRAAEPIAVSDKTETSTLDDVTTFPAATAPAATTPAATAPAANTPAATTPAATTPAATTPAAASPTPPSPPTTATRETASSSEVEEVELDRGNATTVATDGDPPASEKLPEPATAPSPAEASGHMIAGSSKASNDGDDHMLPLWGAAELATPIYDAAEFGDAVITQDQFAMVTLETFHSPEIICVLTWRDCRRLEPAGQLLWAVLMKGCTNPCISLKVVIWAVTVLDPLELLNESPSEGFPITTPATMAMTIAPSTATTAFTGIMTSVRAVRLTTPLAASTTTQSGMLMWIYPVSRSEMSKEENNTTAAVVTINAVADEVVDSSTVLRGVTILFAAVTMLWCTGCICAARRPLRHGGRAIPGERETLAFWRRLLAVWSLGLVCGGSTILYLALFAYATLWAWVCRGTATGHVATLVVIALVKVYAIPLRVHTRGVPIGRLSHPAIALWRRYFAFSCVFDQGAGGSNKKNQNGNNQRQGRRKRSRRVVARAKRLSKGKRRRRRLDAASRTFLLAQIPHGIMPFGALLGIGVLANSLPGMFPIGGVVADALLKAPILRRLVNWVGVRRASVDSIVGMFADGFKAVGVVTGGVAEMFINWRTERIVAPRPNFAKIALQGGHHIVIVFVYGVSRTHRMAFGSSSASKKAGFPLLMGYGAFLNIPFREELKMVVSKPIIVKRIEEPTDDDVASLRKRIEAELHRLYYCHRPEWESRPLEIVRGEISPAELEALEVKASASTASPFAT